MIRTLVIGDIHGCFSELQELLTAAGIGDDDRVVAVGDVVDRGPESPAVLAFLARRPHTHAVMGNHERKHVLAASGQGRLSRSQLITRDQFGYRAYPTAVEQMRRFEPYVQLPEALVIHGFLEPGLTLDAQWPQVLAGTMAGARRVEELPAPWYEMWDGQLPVIFGHRNYTGTAEPLVIHGRAYGLDSGCVYGGSLTGLLLPEFTLVSVPARRDHWGVVSGQHLALRHFETPPEMLDWASAKATLDRADRTADLPEEESRRAEVVREIVTKAEDVLAQLVAANPEGSGIKSLRRRFATPAEAAKLWRC